MTMAESSDITITQCISTLDSGFDSQFRNVDLVRSAEAEARRWPRKIGGTNECGVRLSSSRLNSSEGPRDKGGKARSRRERHDPGGCQKQTSRSLASEHSEHEHDDWFRTKQKRRAGESRLAWQLRRGPSAS